MASFLCLLDVFLPILYIHALCRSMLQPSALEVVESRAFGGVIGIDATHISGFTQFGLVIGKEVEFKGKWVMANITYSINPKAWTVAIIYFAIVRELAN